MDERKNELKELEDGKKADTEARNQLFESLGEALILRIGDDDPFSEEGPPLPGSAESTPGSVLKEYRKCRKEISDSEENIHSLEAELACLKDLEDKISAKEEEQAVLEKELEEAHVQLGKALLLTLNDNEMPESLKLEKKTLLAKIEDQEEKIKKLEDSNGGFFSNLGKNAQMAVYKTMIKQHRLSLERLYHKTGKKFYSDEVVVAPDSESSSSFKSFPEGEAAISSARVRELRTTLASIASELSLLREERQKLTDSFGVEGSPSRRINALEKHIGNVKRGFGRIYLNFGSMAGDKDLRAAFTPFLREEDSSVLEKTEKYALQIAEKELAAEKINASIAIDNETAEIEKLNKSILGQKKKIAEAEEAIAGLEKLAANSQSKIEDLKAFINKDNGS
jgi:hypothetical protein